LLPFVLVC